MLALLPEGGPPTPAGILAVPEAALRAAGLSRAKTAYIRDLAVRVRGGDVHLDAFGRSTTNRVVAELTKVKGIGRWTAEMFLMFRLHRPDVLPVADVGIVNAIRARVSLAKEPAPERMQKIAEPWRPYRSVACWYLWRSLDARARKVKVCQRRSCRSRWVTYATLVGGRAANPAPDAAIDGGRTSPCR